MNHHMHGRYSRIIAAWLALVGLWIGFGPVRAQPPRALPLGQLPGDTRLGPLRGETGDFSFHPAASPEAWEQRAKRVRQMMQVTLGLWPMPTALGLQPVIHGRIEQDDYTVEKVIFETVPGLFVTGNLYRGKGALGKRPAVLSPHGHFPGGRFQDADQQSVDQLLAQGAELDRQAARSFMQSRCVQLARMGCVVFHYDMIGYGDCQQLKLDLVHRFSQLRRGFSTPPERGFYSASAELQLINPMGLHTYHSIRALDFLLGLPDVDPSRVAVTGGSGGGTQTFMLCAVDPRPLVSVPVVIVSTTRQGGCTCENISGLRIGNYNLEFTALHAPKPLLLISADDATRTMPEQGFPDLRQHYAMLGDADQVAHVALLQFPHNYNLFSRTAMYHWLNRHLELGLGESIRERPYRHLSQQQLTVWSDEQPCPAFSPHTEAAIVDWLTRDARRQTDDLIPHDADSLQVYRDVVGTAWKVLLRELPASANLRFTETKAMDVGGHRAALGLLRYDSVEQHSAELPILRLSPRTAGKRTVVWIDQAGKAGLYDASGVIASPVQQLLDSGVTVIGVDLLYQGEFLSDARPLRRQRCLEGEEAFAGWTYCYNLPLFARRVHDVLAVIQWVQGESGPQSEIDLMGLNRSGHWAAAALALNPHAVTRAAIDTNGFRFSQLTDVYDADFLPGGGKYHDLPGLLTLAAPTRLWLAGEWPHTCGAVRAAYEASGRSENLTLVSGNIPDKAQAVCDWLLKPK